MRFNIFNQVHKGLRALLYDTALSLQQTDFSNAEEAEPALHKIRKTLDAFESHAYIEDSYVLPAIQQYEPALVDAFEGEHIKDHELGEKVIVLVNNLEQENSAQVQTAKAVELLHAFNAFLSFNIDHMSREETVLNERLWRYYSDAEIIAINHRILENVKPADLAFYSAWMMKGLSNTEITCWLKEVQRNAPDYVFANLFSIAEKELPQTRFRKILEDLTEGAMVA